MTHIPVLSSTLWPRISQRFYPVSTAYMRKLGVVEKAPTPCSTIDQFFKVTTTGPAAEETIDNQFLRWLLPSQLDLSPSFQPLFQDRCSTCDLVLSSDPRASCIVCRNCGESMTVLFGSSNQTGEVSNTAFTDDIHGPKRVTTYMYKRTNHFIDHLKRVQAKETTNIKPCVLEAVKSELGKERLGVGDPRITTTKIRGILKKLKLQKFYNHVFAITSMLSGKAAPTLTTAQEEKLLSLFQMIQEPFNRVCPPSRTNMISYSYINRKLVEILGWYELVEYFPSLKSRQKIYAQDKIWKEICRETGLPFHRTIS